MQKIITQKQIDAIMAIMFNYNVGAKDYQAVQEMMAKLPEIEGEKKKPEEKVA
jgi:uncharacterized membrane protein